MKYIYYPEHTYSRIDVRNMSEDEISWCMNMYEAHNNSENWWLDDLDITYCTIKDMLVTHFPEYLI